MTTQHLRSHTNLAGSAAIASALVLLLATGACGEEFEGTGGQGAAVVGGSGGTGAVGGGGTGGSGGSGADAGSGGTGGQTCTPDATQPCYSGPQDTRGVGNCTDGEQTCTQGGTWGACVGDVTPAAHEDCNVQGDEDCDGAVCADARWAIMAGDSASQIALSVAIDSQGDVIVAGLFEGTMDEFGESITSAGSQDVFLAKLSGVDGTSLWVKRFGGAMEERELFIAVDGSDNIVITGGYRGTINFGGSDLMAPAGVIDIYLAKLDSAGEHQWSKYLTQHASPPVTVDPTGSKIPAGIAIDGNDNIVLGGRCTGHWGGTSINPTDPANGAAGFVRVYAPDGTLDWARIYDDPDDQEVTAIAVDAGGNIVMAGRFEGSITLGGEVHNEPAPSNEGHGFIADVDAGGTVPWSDAFGAAVSFSTQLPRRMIRTANGITLGGAFQTAIDFDGVVNGDSSARDMFLARYPAAGSTAAWHEEYGSALEQGLWGLAETTSGDLVVAASMAGSFDFAGSIVTAQSDSDALVGKLDSDRNHLWSRQYGVNGNSYAFTIATGPADEIVVAGASTGDMTFGPGLEFLNAGGFDLFVAVLEP